MKHYADKYVFNIEHYNVPILHIKSSFLPMFWTCSGTINSDLQLINYAFSKKICSSFKTLNFL